MSNNTGSDHSNESPRTSTDPKDGMSHHTYKFLLSIGAVFSSFYNPVNVRCLGRYIANLEFNDVNDIVLSDIAKAFECHRDLIYHLHDNFQATSECLPYTGEDVRRLARKLWEMEANLDNQTMLSEIGLGFDIIRDCFYNPTHQRRFPFLYAYEIIVNRVSCLRLINMQAYLVAIDANDSKQDIISAILNPNTKPMREHVSDAIPTDIHEVLDSKTYQQSNSERLQTVAAKDVAEETRIIPSPQNNHLEVKETDDAAVDLKLKPLQTGSKDFAFKMENEVVNLHLASKSYSEKEDHVFTETRHDDVKVDTVIKQSTDIESLQPMVPNDGIENLNCKEHTDSESLQESTKQERPKTFSRVAHFVRNWLIAFTKNM